MCKHCFLRLTYGQSRCEQDGFFQNRMRGKRKCLLLWTELPLRIKEDRKWGRLAGLFRPQEHQLGMHGVTAGPMICPRRVQVGGFQACAECVTPLPHHFSILLFHVLFCPTDTSNDPRLSVCKDGVQTPLQLKLFQG